MEPLLTEKDLAEILQTSAAQVAKWRRAKNWPHVRLGRDVRYRPEQVRDIIDGQTVAGGMTSPTSAPVQGHGALPGQNARSVARSR